MNNKYLDIRQLGFSPSGKTQVWGVFSVNQGALLGEIRWFGRWRQYTFAPRPETTFNPDCLDTISEFIRDLMEDRKNDCGVFGSYGGSGA